MGEEVPGDRGHRHVRQRRARHRRPRAQDGGVRLHHETVQLRRPADHHRERAPQEGSRAAARRLPHEPRGKGERADRHHQLDVRPVHRRDDQGARGEGLLHPRPLAACDALLRGHRRGTGDEGAGAGRPSPGVGAARPREDRRPGSGPEQAREALGRGVRGDRPPPQRRPSGSSSRSHSSAPCSPPSCTTTNGSTGRGTPRASRGPASLSRPAS